MNGQFAPDIKALWPLRSTCSPAERHLLFGLRAMGALPHHHQQVVAALTALGIDSSGVFNLAELRSVIASEAPGLRMLDAGAAYVALDELDLLACLNRMVRGDIIAAVLRNGPDDRENRLLTALHRAALTLRHAGVKLRQRTPAGSGRRVLEHEAMAIDARRAASMRLRPVKVSRIAELSSALRRITFSGAALEGFLPDCPAQWLTLFAPMSLGDLGDVGRAYTIRHYRPELQEVDIDIALHDGGPLSRWAASAWAGQVLKMSGARGGYVVAPEAPWLLLAGDASALPAIATIIEAQAPEKMVKVCLELGDERDLDCLPGSRPFELHWAVRRRRARAMQGALLPLVEAVTLPAGAGQAWLGGEATVVRNVRQYLMTARYLASAQVHGVAHWKRRERDHVDMAAG